MPVMYRETQNQYKYKIPTEISINTICSSKTMYINFVPHKKIMIIFHNKKKYNDLLQNLR